MAAKVVVEVRGMAHPAVHHRAGQEVAVAVATIVGRWEKQSFVPFLQDDKRDLNRGIPRVEASRASSPPSKTWTLGA